MIVAVKFGEHDLELPKRATDGSAGMDLQSAEKRTVVIQPGCRLIIPTGFGYSIPKDYVGLVWPRSGMAVKHGIDVLAGCIDSDYRGEVMVVLQNHGALPFTVNYGDRVAQLLMMPCFTINAKLQLDFFDQTDRGAGGFGSTGA